MTAFVVYGDRNLDCCYTAAGAVAAPSPNATLDTYSINGAKLTIDSDTRYCPGRNGSVATGGTGALETVTVSAALGGEVLIDGTNVRIIPYKSGTGTPNVQSAGLYTSVLVWASGVVTATTSAIHSLTTGDFVAIGGAEPNGYNGIWQVTVTNTTTFTFELATDPGISTVTNATAVKYYHVRQPQGSQITVSARSFSTNTVTYTANSHPFLVNDWILISGVTPTAHNGHFKIVAVTTNTFDIIRTTDSGAITVSGTAQKCAQGFFLGFWSALNVAGNPQGMVAAAAIAATGFLKFKGTRGSFVANSTVTVQATVSTTVIATAPDMPGWMEVVGLTTGIMTIPRLGKFTTSGTWFNPILLPQVTTGTTWSANVVTLTFAAPHGITIGSRIIVTGATTSSAINGTWIVASVPTTTTLTFALSGSGGADGVVNVLAEVCTSGVANQTIQLPASTVLTYYAGVWIETTSGSDVYEFWPSAGSYVTAGISTNQSIGKICWISSQGLLRIGSDGTNTHGAVPTSGRRIRVPNINFVNATRAATPGVGPNVANSATLTARQTFVSTGSNTGIINIDKANSNWYLNFVQTSSLSLSDVGITEGINFSEIAQPYTFSNVGVGQSAALSVQAITQAMCFAGGTETNCVWSRALLGAASNYVGSRTDCFNLTISGEKAVSIGARANNTTGAWNHTRLNDSTFTNSIIHCGGVTLTTCSGVSYTNTEYADAIQSAAITTFPQYVFSATTNSINLKFDGITHAGSLAANAAYNGILYTAIGCRNIKLRNIGSVSVPLDLGSRGAYVFASGTGASGGCSNIEIKRVYCSNTRTGLFTADNSLSGLTMENVWGDEADTVTASVLNCQLKGIRGTAVTTGQTAVYGSHWQDFVYSAGNTGKIALAFNEKTGISPSATTISVQQLNLPSGFNSAGVVQMPLLNDELTIETPVNIINHASFAVAAPTYVSTTALAATAGSWSANYTTLTIGTHGLTAGDTIVVTGALPAAYNGVFVITNIVSATAVRYYQASTPGTWASGGNILPLDNLDTFYYISVGAGYGPKRNLRYVRTGAATTNASAIITVTNTIGIEVGDYVTSKVAGAGTSARVLSVDSGTQITVNVVSSATTTSNVLYFNHLPFESSIPAAGFKLKINIKSWANNNIASITNISIPTITDATSRGYQYPLETNTLTLTNIPAGTEVRVRQGSYTLDQQQDVNSGSYTLSHSLSGKLVRFQFTLPGYVFEDIDWTLTATDVTLPITYAPDPSYSFS